MDLRNAYYAADAILRTLDFGALFPGFRKYRFALYNSKQICFDGTLIPYEEAFRGNTSISYGNEWIAIWDMEMDPMEDMERLAYCLVHEMFHCHQNNHKEDRYPSDLVLLKYPNDMDNYLKKFNENGCLAAAYETQDMEKFKQFHATRNLRLKKYPEMVEQELRVETLEGLAEYVGLAALRRINAAKFKALTDDYMSKLKAVDPLFFDIRKLSYYTGAVYFLCLELFAELERCAFADTITAYERNVPLFGDTAVPALSPCDSLADLHGDLVKKKERILCEHLSKSAFTPCEATICGYDPMNMFRLEDLILCSHFVCLRVGDRVETITSAVALKMKDNSTEEIIGYYRSEEKADSE